MAILRFEATRREVGAFVILDDVTASLAHGERVGLVGANGAGKTTLLRLAAGLDEPDRGLVARKRGLSVGMLAQEANLDAVFTAAPTVRAAVRAGAADVEAMERELARLEGSGAEGVASAAYADLRARFEARDGYHLDQRVETTLSGLGFEAAEWDRPPVSLSGGEQTRAALARLLVADPDLLLLDEPTNHLDVAALEWLEQALVRRDRAVVVASHDRAFLDAVVGRIWELRDRRLRPFRGGYSAYLLQREAADARQRKDAETGTEAIERERELVQRYRSHRKYAKMHEHERRLEALQAARAEAPRTRARLALTDRALLGGGPVRSGDLVIALRDALLGFPPAPDQPDGVPVAWVARLEAQRGDRIGIVGPNGAGKTTLLRTIAGELGPLEGTVRLGAAVQPGYLAQLRASAIPGATVLDALLETVNVEMGPARSYLARFLFRGEDVFKPVSELSGGERSRLELALLGVTPANLLLLDEPTNHLDIPAREALEAFLRESAATLLVVSHDRRLLETIAERLWVVEPGRAGEPGRIAAFDGGWRQWRAAVGDGWTVAAELELQSRRLDGRTSALRRASAAAAPLAAAVGSNGSHPLGGGGAGAGARAGAGTRSGTGARAPQPPLSKDAYRRQRVAVDADLTRLGLRKNHLELALGRPDVQGNFVELRRLTSELADVDAALAQAEDAWLALEERAPR
ncbi:MAG: ABC-F family ATP-binding cassette domain-containing protein [Candidatus Limnocylindrales bacterium]